MNIALQGLESPLAERLTDESRAAFGSGDVSRAVSLARAASDVEPPTPVAFRHLAFVLDVAGDSRGAADALRRLSKCARLSGDEEYYASALLCKAEEFDLAADHAAAAVALDPKRLEFLRHAANLFAFTRRHGEAVQINVQLLQLAGEDAAIYHQIASAFGPLGRKDLALTCAERAHALDPGKLEYLLTLAHLLVVDQQYETAIARLEKQAPEFSGQSTFAFFHSVCLAGLKRFEESLVAVEIGIAANPDNSELRMHRGSVLCFLRRYEEAVEDFRHVLRRDPTNSGARRAAFAALTEAGLYADAVAHGAELLVADPQDRSVGRTMQVVLTHRFSEFVDSGQMTGLDLLALKRAAARNRRAPPPPAVSPFVKQMGVVYALILREINTKFGRARLGFVWAVFEPLAHIGLMITLIAGFGHGKPPFGDSFAVFYFTGIIPYHLATHTSSGLLHAVPGNRSVLQIPAVTLLDVMCARGLVELFTEICVATALLMVFLALDLHALPHDPMKVLRSLGYLWAAAVGIGLMNACAVTFLTSWEKIWGALTGVLYFASGTFYVPAMMPVWARDVLDWNPILQSIELVRSGFFAGHDPVWMSESYLAMFALISLVLGLAGERFLRRRLLSH